MKMYFRLCFIAIISALTISCSNEGKVKDAFNKYVTEKGMKDINFLSVDTMEVIKLSKDSLKEWKNSDSLTIAKTESLSKESENLNAIENKLTGNMTIGQLSENYDYMFASNILMKIRMNTYPIEYFQNYTTYKHFEHEYLQKGDTVFVLGSVTYKTPGHLEKKMYFSTDENYKSINFEDNLTQYEKLAQLANRKQISKHYHHYNDALVKYYTIERDALKDMIKSLQ